MFTGCPYFPGLQGDSIFYFNERDCSEYQRISPSGSKDVWIKKEFVATVQFL